MSYPLENARFQWETGWTHLQELSEDPAVRRQADRVIDVIREELRRRLGTGFGAEELANLYGEGTDWCMAYAVELTGSGADPHDVIDAAFYQHLRLAGDFSGGRRHAPE